MSQETHGALSEAPEETAWRVPGRVEVLGKHTDYAGGSVPEKRIVTQPPQVK